MFMCLFTECIILHDNMPVSSNDRLSLSNQAVLFYLVLKSNNFFSLLGDVNNVKQHILLKYAVIGYSGKIVFIKAELKAHTEESFYN